MGHPRLYPQSADLADEPERVIAVVMSWQIALPFATRSTPMNHMSTQYPQSSIENTELIGQVRRFGPLGVLWV